jgi:uncharacterized SAM-binding protein YcdF (DUF218 family)
MFFELSKILWAIFNPGNLLIILLLFGAVLLWTRWLILGKWIVGLISLFFLMIALLPFGKWMFEVLENRFPPIVQLPEKVDGIIVAGGIVDPLSSKEHGQISINGAFERVYEFAVLSKRYPNAKLIFTGGSGSLFFQDLKEADVLAPLLRQLGVDTSRVIFENQSKNTFENALLSYRIVKPKTSESWLLITSAFHMPRSVGVFRKVGWNVIPYSVDYQIHNTKTLQLFFNYSGGLSSLSRSIHEFCGLLFYWLSGKTDELFPEPK